MSKDRAHGSVRLPFELTADAEHCPPADRGGRTDPYTATKQNVLAYCWARPNERSARG